jgi:uncharacterized protein YjbI with pentapeptide repeats
MPRFLAFVCLQVLVYSSATAADLSVEQVRSIITAASPGTVPNLSGKSLEQLDLSGIDFKHAKLREVSFYGAKLVDADLSRTDLSGATLNLAWIMRAKFDGADLSGARLQGLVVSSGLEFSPTEAPSFKAANFSGARIIARFSRLDLSGANFSSARLGADMTNQSMGLMRTELSGAKLAGANFAGADLARALLSFADLRGANLAGANLTGADFSGADLTGANLTKATATDADFGNAKLEGVIGLDTVIGLDLKRR